MKRLTLVISLVILIAAVLAPSFATGADGSANVNVSVTISFPMSITFSITASAANRIDDIRLHYTVDRMKIAEVITEEVIQFTPSKNVSTQYMMDMRQTGGFPPGASLTYWLTVKDSAGVITETLPDKLYINDNRYQWQSLKEGLVTLYWYDRDNAYGAELMATAQQALTRVAGNSGAALDKPVKLYIYANNADLLGALVFAQEWTGGVAFTDYNIIAIGIGPSTGDKEWGKETIFHELTHLVVHQVTFNPYGGPPPWLDEGLALNSENEFDQQFVWSLDRAVADDTLISVQSLCSPFSAYADEAVLAYAESYQIVRYLIDTYGQSKMLELLMVYKNGSGNNEALQAVYGFGMDNLNTQWQDAFKASLVTP